MKKELLAIFSVLFFEKMFFIRIIHSIIAFKNYAIHEVLARGIIYFKLNYNRNIIINKFIFKEGQL